MSKELEIQGIQDRIALLIKKLNVLKKDRIVKTDGSEQFKLDQEIEELEKELLTEKAQLAKLQSAHNPSLNNTLSTKFNTHHQFTANRTKQDGDFIKYIYQKAETSEKLHFFYLHGGDLQEHKGLYKRFVNKLAGRDTDFKTDYKASDIIVKDFDAIRFPNYTEEETLKIGIASSLMDSLNIPERDMAKVLDKNLAYALAESPDLENLTTHDKVCFFLSISESNWNAQLTPDITRWFITHFCQKGFPENAPHFYFFFAVEYDEDNETIKEELSTALDKADFTVALPELEMVSKKDIQAWLDHYDDFWPRRSDRKKTFKKHFEEEGEEMYMDDVQFLLLKIINEINNAEKYGT